MKHEPRCLGFICTCRKAPPVMDRDPIFYPAIAFCAAAGAIAVALFYGLGGQ